jgi:hypothetical protein
VPQRIARHPERGKYRYAEFRVGVQRHSQVAELVLDRRADIGLDELDRIIQAKRISGDQVQPGLQHT